MAKTERRPQVLLLGNGLNQAYGASSWDQLMKTLSIRTDLPDKLSIPRPLQAVLVTNDTVDTTMKRHANALYGGRYTAPASLYRLRSYSDNKLQLRAGGRRSSRRGKKRIQAKKADAAYERSIPRQL